MGQKVHPLGFRLGITTPHRAHWFNKKNGYATRVQQDYVIRKYLRTVFEEMGVISEVINRQQYQTHIHLNVQPFSKLLKYTHEEFENIRTSLRSVLLQQANSSDLKEQSLTFHIHSQKDPDKSAEVLASAVVRQLETRVPFRRAVRTVSLRAEKAGVQGIKIQISGRLNGAEIARSEWVRKGRVPLHTLRANIDYCVQTAQTTYGILGVKVWVCLPE